MTVATNSTLYQTRAGLSSIKFNLNVVTKDKEINEGEEEKGEEECKRKKEETKTKN